MVGRKNSTPGQRGNQRTESAPLTREETAHWLLQELLNHRELTLLLCRQSPAKSSWGRASFQVLDPDTPAVEDPLGDQLDSTLQMVQRAGLRRYGELDGWPTVRLKAAIAWAQRCGLSFPLSDPSARPPLTRSPARRRRRTPTRDNLKREYAEFRKNHRGRRPTQKEFITYCAGRHGRTVIQEHWDDLTELE